MWAERPAEMAHLVRPSVRVKRWTVCPVGDLSASSPGAMMEWRQDEVVVSQILMEPSSPQLKRRVEESQSRQLVPPACPSSLQWMAPDLKSMRMISSSTVDAATNFPSGGGRAMLMIASSNLGRKIARCLDYFIEFRVFIDVIHLFFVRFSYVYAYGTSYSHNFVL